MHPLTSCISTRVVDPFVAYASLSCDRLCKGGTPPDATRWSGRVPRACCHKAAWPAQLPCRICGNARGCIFAPEHLPDVSPSGSGFLQLTADCLNIVIILGKQAPQIFKYLNPIKVPTCPHGQKSTAKVPVPTLPPPPADVSVQLLPVTPLSINGKGRWVAPASCISYTNQTSPLLEMNGPKVPPHHPAIPHSTLASWERASQATVQLLTDGVCHDETDLEEVLGYNKLLENIVDICQVAAKRACLQYLYALAAFNVASTSPLHPPVGLNWESSPDAIQGADHGLHLQRVHLKPHPFEKSHLTVQCALQEFHIPQGKVSVIDLEDGKEGCC
jgi:hypothetical protein